MSLPEAPDRLSADPDSEHYAEIGVWVGVTLDGKDVNNVEEYCMSEGWLRRIDENSLRAGIKTFETLRGEVKAYVKAQ